MLYSQFWETPYSSVRLSHFSPYTADGKKCPSREELHIKCIFYSFWAIFAPRPAGLHILPRPVTGCIEMYDRPSLDSSREPVPPYTYGGGSGIIVFIWWNFHSPPNRYAYPSRGVVFYLGISRIHPGVTSADFTAGHHLRIHERSPSLAPGRVAYSFWYKFHHGGGGVVRKWRKCNKAQAIWLHSLGIADWEKICALLCDPIKYL
jgi:hypothetical protein